MKPISGSAVCFMSFLGGIKIAKEVIFAIRCYRRRPSSPFFVPKCSFEACRIIATNTAIPPILHLSRLTQIIPAIIGTIGVFVISLRFWPCAGRDKPSQAMGHIFSAVDRDANIAVICDGARRLAGPFAIPPWCRIGSLFPRQQSVAWIVGQNRPNIPGTKIIAIARACLHNCISHSALLRSLWSGSDLSAATLIRPDLIAQKWRLT